MQSPWAEARYSRSIYYYNSVIVSVFPLGQYQFLLSWFATIILQIQNTCGCHLLCKRTLTLSFFYLFVTKASFHLGLCFLSLTIIQTCTCHWLCYWVHQLNWHGEDRSLLERVWLAVSCSTQQNATPDFDKSLHTAFGWHIWAHAI